MFLIALLSKSKEVSQGPLNPINTHLVSLKDSGKFLSCGYSKSAWAIRHAPLYGALHLLITR